MIHTAKKHVAYRIVRTTNKNRPKPQKTPTTKQLRQEFIDSGDAEKSAQAASVAYILYSVAQAYQEESDGYLKKHGLMRGDVKERAEWLNLSFDRYHNCIKPLIKPDGNDAVCADFDELTELINNWVHSARQTP